MNNHEQRTTNCSPYGSSGFRVPMKADRAAEQQEYKAIDEDQRGICQLQLHHNQSLKRIRLNLN